MGIGAQELGSGVRDPVSVRVEVVLGDIAGEDGGMQRNIPLLEQSFHPNEAPVERHAIRNRKGRESAVGSLASSLVRVVDSL